jgi:hypothetical protein
VTGVGRGFRRRGAKKVGGACSRAKRRRRRRRFGGAESARKKEQKMVRDKNKFWREIQFRATADRAFSSCGLSRNFFLLLLNSEKEKGFLSVR